MANKNSQGNPGTGSSDDFFDAMDRDVNGAILDKEDQQVQDNPTDNGPIEETRNLSEGPNLNMVDWEKRYKDSSREATKMAGELKQLKPFVPLLKVMKQDSGLVDTVKDYLTNGGKPAKSVQEQLGLDEDFVFDANDIADPDSDSAKVMNAHVDGMVKQRVGQMLNVEKQRAQQMQQVQARATEEQAFMKKNNMSETEFNDFKEKAQKHVMTLDDVNYLLNRNQNNANVANSTKTDMLNQMKNVRNMPTSASGANSQGQQRSESDEVFDLINGFDSDVDNLFG